MGKSTGKHNIYAILAGSKTDISPIEGTATANKAVVLDSNKAIDVVRTASLRVGTAGSETTVTATGAELNLNDNQVANVVYTIGAEATNVINVGIQANDAAGTAMTNINCLRFYLSSDAAGKDIETSGVDSWAIGTDGSLIPDGGDSVISGAFITEADGDCDIDMTHVGADTFYMNTIMPNGSVVTSAAITFDSDT